MTTSRGGRRVPARGIVALRQIVDLAIVLLVGVLLVGVALVKGAPLIGRETMVIGGGSMEPAIALGSAVVIRPADPLTLATGDVVSIQVGPDRTTFTHRIVAVIDRADGRWIRTQGDANAAPDPTLVPAAAVIGRVEAVIPMAGYVLALLSLPMGVVFVLGLAATLLTLAWLLDPRELAARETGGPAITSGEDASAQRAPQRPTVREQIQHSRDARRRRSQWPATTNRPDVTG